jgi:serine/threonine protein kinase
MERYTIGEQIGEGSFGHVFLAVKNDTNEKVNPFFLVSECCCRCVTL